LICIDLIMYLRTRVRSVLHVRTYLELRYVQDSVLFKAIARNLFRGRYPHWATSLSFLPFFIPSVQFLSLPFALPKVTPEVQLRVWYSAVSSHSGSWQEPWPPMNIEPSDHV